MSKQPDTLKLDVCFGHIDDLYTEEGDDDGYCVVCHLHEVQADYGTIDAALRQALKVFDKIDSEITWPPHLLEKVREITELREKWLTDEE